MIIPAIGTFQREVREFCEIKKFEKDIGLRMMYLVSELGEMSKELIALSNPKLTEQQRDEVKAKLGLELYDCIWNLVDLANLNEVDLSESFSNKIEINKDREWR